MMNLAINDHRLAKPGPLNAALRDYDSVRRAIAFISERWRDQPGIEQVALGVSCQNAPAKALYESFGFEVYGCEKRALKIGDEYVDEELMVLYFSR